MHLTLTINSTRQELDVAPGTTLLSALRDDLGLTGTRYGCGHGVCGACFVLIDGQPTAACVTRVDELPGKAIVTVEGLAKNGELHPVQRAFLEEDAMQCGYCTGGMLISAVALLARVKRPTEAQIRTSLDPHLCRCGVYGRAVRAILKAAR
jgi:aerobic-type carbon monoxide dehydrogenase small subunit (CoxS/CutS family)